MKVYIAGKITGQEDYKEKFNKAERLLKLKGNTVINPVKLFDILGEKFEHWEYMIVCFSLIDLCECVYLLDNWNESNGATLEVEYARTRGIKVLMLGEEE